MIQLNDFVLNETKEKIFTENCKSLISKGIGNIVINSIPKVDNTDVNFYKSKVFLDSTVEDIKNIISQRSEYKYNDMVSLEEIDIYNKKNLFDFISTNIQYHIKEAARMGIEDLIIESNTFEEFKELRDNFKISEETISDIEEINSTILGFNLGLEEGTEDEAGIDKSDEDTKDAEDDSVTTADDDVDEDMKEAETNTDIETVSDDQNIKPNVVNAIRKEVTDQLIAAKNKQAIVEKVISAVHEATVNAGKKIEKELIKPEKPEEDEIEEVESTDTGEPEGDTAADTEGGDTTNPEDGVSDNNAEPEPTGGGEEPAVEDKPATKEPAAEGDSVTTADDDVEEDVGENENKKEPPKEEGKESFEYDIDQKDFIEYSELDIISEENDNSVISDIENEKFIFSEEARVNRKEFISKFIDDELVDKVFKTINGFCKESTNLLKRLWDMCWVIKYTKDKSDIEVKEQIAKDILKCLLKSRFKDKTIDRKQSKLFGKGDLSDMNAKNKIGFHFKIAGFDLSVFKNVVNGVFLPVAVIKNIVRSKKNVINILKYQDKAKEMCKDYGDFVITRLLKRGILTTGLVKKMFSIVAFTNDQMKKMIKRVSDEYGIGQEDFLEYFGLLDIVSVDQISEENDNSVIPVSSKEERKESKASDIENEEFIFSEEVKVNKKEFIDGFMEDKLVDNIFKTINGFCEKSTNQLKRLWNICRVIKYTKDKTENEVKEQIAKDILKCLLKSKFENRIIDEKQSKLFGKDDLADMRKVKNKIGFYFGIAGFNTSLIKNITGSIISPLGFGIMNLIRNKKNVADIKKYQNDAKKMCKNYGEFVITRVFSRNLSSAGIANKMFTVVAFTNDQMKKLVKRVSDEYDIGQEEFLEYFGLLDIVSKNQISEESNNLIIPVSRDVRSGISTTTMKKFPKLSIEELIPLSPIKISTKVQPEEITLLALEDNSNINKIDSRLYALKKVSSKETIDDKDKQKFQELNEKIKIGLETYKLVDNMSLRTGVGYNKVHLTENNKNLVKSFIKKVLLGEGNTTEFDDGISEETYSDYIIDTALMKNSILGIENTERAVYLNEAIYEREKEIEKVNQETGTEDISGGTSGRATKFLDTISSVDNISSLFNVQEIVDSYNAQIKDEMEADIIIDKDQIEKDVCVALEGKCEITDDTKKFINRVINNKSIISDDMSLLETLTVKIGEEMIRNEEDNPTSSRRKINYYSTLIIGLEKLGVIDKQDSKNFINGLLYSKIK